MRRGQAPVRTCVICGTKTAKEQLVRVVRADTGRVEVDTTGKRPGRGAYLCLSDGCWARAQKRSRLDHALRGPLSPEDRQALGDWARTRAETTGQG